MDLYIQAGKFKEQCLKIMEEVKTSGREVIITKRHIPIVRLCPIERREMSLFGKLEGTVHTHGDIIQPIDEGWNADYNTN